MKIEQDIKLDFSDVLMRPKRSTLSSRSEVDLIRTLKFPNSGQSWSGVPIMVANMDTVGTLDMFNALYKNRMMTCLHKYVSAEDIIELFKQYEGLPDDELHPINYMILSTGITESNWDNLNSTIAKLSENGIEVKFICVDVANGYMDSFSNFCKRVRTRYPNKTIIAGNVVTREIVEELILNCGVDIVKCGIGSGCFAGDTRVLMANGIYKNICDIEVGEFVINMNGEPVKVLNKMNKGFMKVVNMRTNNWHGRTIVTDNHKFFTGDLSSSSIKSISNNGKAKLLDKQSKTIPKKSKYKWCQLNELDEKKSTFLMPKKYNWLLKDNFQIDLSDFVTRAKVSDEKIITNGNCEFNRFINSDYDLGYIFGTFLGDGHSKITVHNNSEMGSVHWYFSLHETDIAEKLKNSIKKHLNYEVKIVPEKNVLKVNCYNKHFAKMLFEFGKKNDKQLPSKYYCKDKDYIKGIFDGLNDSDGHLEVTKKENKIFTFVNTSKYLIELYYWCCMNLNTSFSSCKNKKTIGGLKNVKNENIKDIFRVKTHTFNRYTNNYVYSDIIDKRDVYDEVEVWDIEVDCDTHSFIANNSIVHNSVCTTRLQTGVGMPQFSTILECADAAHGLNGHIISDGGVKVPGDFSKAFAGGADFVMSGSMFAGFDESAGDLVTDEDGRKFKTFYGMSSATSMNKYHGGVAKHRSSEGKTVKVPYKGPVQEQVYNILGGIRSTCTYTGAKRLKDLPKCATFIRVNNQVNNKYSHEKFLV